MKTAQAYNHTLFIIAMLLVSACTTYVKLAETTCDNTYIDEDKYCVYENDTIKIAYNFWSNQGNFNFRVYNKTDKFLYIDWKKSSLVFNDLSLPYYENKTTSQDYLIPSPRVGNTQYLKKNIGITTERITIIPPNAYVFVPIVYPIFQRFPIKIPYRTTFNPDKMLHFDTSYKKITSPSTLDSNKFINSWVKTWDFENSPLHLINYISYSMTEDFKEEQLIKNVFYLSSYAEIDYLNFMGNTNNNSINSNNTKDKFNANNPEMQYSESAFRAGNRFYKILQM